jgi:dihydropteroate synthase
MRLRAGDRTVDLTGAPLLMGIVNASPDSFSDAGRYPTVDAQIARGLELLEAGADMIDVGGESGITGRPPAEPGEEAARVVPVVEALAARGALVSVDTYKPAVAEAAIAAGAAMVNDVSGLRDPALADVCARAGAALVVMHTRAAPKERLQDPGRYDDVVADAAGFLRGRIELAAERGVDREQIVVDPGPDFAKTPAQTVALLRGLDAVIALGRPVLMAVSRKDFVGAITGRAPAERGAGTLAALAHGADAGAHIFRVHDVAAARDFLAVRAVLRGDADLAAGAALPEALRHQPPD